MKLEKGKRYDEAVQIESPPFRLMVFAEVAGRETENQIRDEIIRRVNAHDALVECVSRYLENFDSDMSNEQVKQWLDREGIPAMRLALATASETRTEADSGAKTGTQGGDTDAG